MKSSTEPMRAEGPGLPRLAAATSIGTAIEYYDFIAYAIATGLVFNKVFFPESDAMVGTLLSFVVFFTGFLARPIGGIIAGHFGDRIGRKKMLITTVVTMGFATVMIGALPTYEQIGVSAPACLLVLRLLQGLAAGGEWGGSALVAVEHAPPGNRGLYGSWSMVGISVGGLLATTVFAALSTMNEQAFLSWGWRIPFLASALLVVVGFWVRSSIAEPKAFQSARQQDSVPRVPLVMLLRESWRTVLLCTGVSIGYNAFIYLVFTFALAYGTQDLGIPRQLILEATVVGLLLQVPAIVLAAMLSDRLGRVRVMVTGALFMAVHSFVFFTLLQSRQTVAVFATIGIAYIGAALMFGPLAAYFAEAFEVGVRYSGVSLCYQVGASIGGGLTPMILTLLLLGTGSTLPVSLYVGGLALIAVFCLLAMSKKGRGSQSTATGDSTEVSAPAPRPNALIVGGNE
ncbi:MAG: MFS transporter [Hyphomicrobiales bacterium]|nr:MAG: MFS transporter [Hyphomicrobiales bacterium]